MDLSDLNAALAARFSDAPEIADLPASGTDFDALHRMAARGVCRHFDARSVGDDVMNTLAAVALCAPSKSDLQQRDVIRLDDETRPAVKSLLSDQDWIADAPEMLVFCGNNLRQRQMHEIWQRPFANDHLDAFFNAAVDAGICLATAVACADAMGLGTCPISTIRNRSTAVRDILDLPDHVFPVAALAVGWPKYPAPRISKRLPLAATVHHGRYEAPDMARVLADYDAERPAKTAQEPQRAPDLFGVADRYSWSDDKTRQYGQPERADFGAFIRKIGFNLD